MNASICLPFIEPAMGVPPGAGGPRGAGSCGGGGGCGGSGGGGGCNGFMGPLPEAVTIILPSGSNLGASICYKPVAWTVPI